MNDDMSPDPGSARETPKLFGVAHVHKNTHNTTKILLFVFQSAHAVFPFPEGGEIVGKDHLHEGAACGTLFQNIPVSTWTYTKDNNI